MGIDDDNPNSHCVGESAVSVCYKDKRLYVANDNHVVQAYTYPAFDKDGIVTRFTAPVTHIMTGSKIELLGCASENMEAKLCSPEGGTPIFVMQEHKGPVLSIAVCPQMKYASTASGDGLLRIWDIDTQKVVKEIVCVPKINTFFMAKVLCRMDFEPAQGNYLAYPNNREIVLLEVSSWNQRMNFTHTSIKCAVSQCLFSSCGQYLSGSTVAGQIAVWEVQSGNCMGIIDHPTSHNVCAMAWNPKGNGILAYCDVGGQLGLLVNCFGVQSEKADNDGDDMDDIVEAVDNSDVMDNLISDDSDDDNAISLEKIKNSTLQPTREPDESRPASRYEPAPSNVPPQPPFQSSSTPVNLEHRYMIWNEVGIVRCHSSANGESNIEVEFHDTSLHHALYLNNYLNHTMASLSTTVLALACETPSKLVCISLVGSSKEWSVSMPDTEEVVCVTAASHVVACATSAGLLRTFTPMGTQRQVVCLSGPAVCLASYNCTVLAAYHSTEPGPKDQHLAMDIVTHNGRQVRSKTVSLPLGAGRKLQWLGLSDAGSPCAADSAGSLRLYDLLGGCWVPVCETSVHARGASDSWFIVSVSEQSQRVRAILCRGSAFPLTAPKPIVTELPIQIPLCELDTEKGQYEEQLVRWAHTTRAAPEPSDLKAAREVALKLFALACRSEIEQRAVELMELLRDDRLVPLAAKYASRLGRVHLADRLATLAAEWEEQADSEQHNVAMELESQERCDVSDQQQDLNNSLIIPQKAAEKKQNVTPIKPVPIIKSSPSAVRNPFKKKQDPTKNVQSPLSLTERTIVEVPPVVHLEEKTDPLKPRDRETFMDWFSRNKTVLEQQSPELTPAELTRHCMRMFKELRGGSGTDNNKRKFDDTQEGPAVSTPKQSKLSAFIYQKST